MEIRNQIRNEYIRLNFHGRGDTIGRMLQGRNPPNRFPHSRGRGYFLGTSGVGFLQKRPMRIPHAPKMGAIVRSFARGRRRVERRGVEIHARDPVTKHTLLTIKHSKPDYKEADESDIAHQYAMDMLTNTP